MLIPEYQRPTTVAEALSLLAREGARVLAGGTDLVPQVREGRRRASVLIDIKHIPELKTVARLADGSWRVGAAVSVSALGRDPVFSAEHSALLASARLIGSLQIQSRATLVGNLANAAPSADAVPLLMALAARAEVATAKGPRVVDAEDIPVGPGRTSLSEGELVTALILPPVPPRSAARYLRFTPRREMDIAIAGSGVLLSLGHDGTIASARIRLAAVAPVPLGARKAQALLCGARPDARLFEAAAIEAAREATPISDMRGSADYRRELVKVLTRRALTECAAALGIAIP